MLYMYMKDNTYQDSIATKGVVCHLTHLVVSRRSGGVIFSLLAVLRNELYRMHALDLSSSPAVQCHPHTRTGV